MSDRRIALASFLAIGLALAGCGGDADSVDARPTTTGASSDSPAGPSDTGSTSASTPNATGPDETEADGSSPDAEDPGGEGNGDAGVDETDLPGEVIDVYPYDGAALAVVGVEVGDTLNVRTGPGTTFDVATEVAPQGEGLRATGHNRSLGSGSIWVQVQVDGVTGWISGRYQAQLGDTQDITSEVGERSAATLAALGQAVASSRLVAGEGPAPRITVAGTSPDGDLAEVVVDVLGFADDAQAGERLRVFALGSDAAGWSVRTVEATALCARGVTDGLCL